MNLKDAAILSKVQVVGISAKGSLRRRFFDLGIIEGTKIEVLFEGALGDPIAYLIRGSIIAIRKEDSNKIQVKTIAK
ncbi:MAG: ferrous iron transport protein A [Clostridiales bacterium]|nr:ferrous iron transport protein A [Clostridiales bacterium]